MVLVRFNFDDYEGDIGLIKKSRWVKYTIPIFHQHITQFENIQYDNNYKTLDNGGHANKT